MHILLPKLHTPPAWISLKDNPHLVYYYSIRTTQNNCIKPSVFHRPIRTTNQPTISSFAYTYFDKWWLLVGSLQSPHITFFSRGNFPPKESSSEEWKKMQTICALIVCFTQTQFFVDDHDFYYCCCFYVYVQYILEFCNRYFYLSAVS